MFRERKIYSFMARRIFHLAKTMRGSRDARALRARRDYKLVSRELVEQYISNPLKSKILLVVQHAPYIHSPNPLYSRMTTFVTFAV